MSRDLTWTDDELILMRLCWYIQKSNSAVVVEPCDSYVYGTKHWEMLHSLGGWLLDIAWVTFSLEVRHKLARSLKAERHQYILSANEWSREFHLRPTDYPDYHNQLRWTFLRYPGIIHYDYIINQEAMERDFLLTRFSTPSWVWNLHELIGT